MLPELAVAGIGGFGAYFFLSRRRTANKLHHFLKLKEEELQLPPGMTQESKLPETDRVQLKEAFLNNADYKWLAAQPGVEDPTRPNSKVALDITWYMVEVALRFVERYGYLLVQRNPKDGTFQGAIGLIPPYKKWWRFKTQYQLAALSLGRVAVPEKLKKEARYQAYQKHVHDHHQEALQKEASGNGHWYIPLVGVASSQKKKGVGRSLAEVATRLCSRPIYLACPESATNFFQKVGFVLDNRFAIMAEGGNQNLERDVIYYNSMTCQ